MIPPSRYVETARCSIEQGRAWVWWPAAAKHDFLLIAPLSRADALLRARDLDLKPLDHGGSHVPSPAETRAATGSARSQVSEAQCSGRRKRQKDASPAILGDNSDMRAQLLRGDVGFDRAFAPAICPAFDRSTRSRPQQFGTP